MSHDSPARPRTVAIIQARMSSSRLPGKVLMPIAGRPAILFMCERVRRARSIDRLCVATSTDPSDDALAACVAEAGIAVHRGSLDDVLDRFQTAAQAHRAELAVRLTGDCPLVDAGLIDRVVALVAGSGFDYASNIDPPTYPDGLDVEAMTMAALEQAAAEAQLGSEREHVTLFIRNRPERFRAGLVASPVDLSALRWTVDYADDLELVRRLVEGVDVDPLAADRYDFLRVYEALGLSGGAHARNEGLASSVARDAAGPDEAA
jgi:spore coat polysaccharide biosynthesis protein SpsF (cytidylyltransferase family)